MAQHRRKSPAEIRRNMSAIRSKGSQIEVALGGALRALGLRYRKNYKNVEGKPDFAFPSLRVAVFCDSSFWHGRGWGIARAAEFRVNRSFWTRKIERNIERDNEVNRYLRGRGWKVLRFWDAQIKNYPSSCAKKVLKVINDRRKVLSVKSAAVVNS